MERNKTFNNTEHKGSDTGNRESDKNPYRGKIRQIGNLSNSSRNNSQRNRLYDPKGICPCLNSMRGGQLTPLIIVKYENQSKHK